MQYIDAILVFLVIFIAIFIAPIWAKIDSIATNQILSNAKINLNLAKLIQEIVILQNIEKNRRTK